MDGSIRFCLANMWGEMLLVYIQLFKELLKCFQASPLAIYENSCLTTSLTTLAMVISLILAIITGM